MNLRPIASGLASSASNAGKGALAGAVATAAMTLTSTIEMKLRGREASSVPAKAAGKVLGVQPRDPEGAARFGNYVHWSYGTAWGALGGVIRTAIPEPYASVAHFSSVWGSEVTMLPALEVVPPLPEWSAEEITIDALHHAVYIVTFAGAWYLLNRAEEPTSLLDSVLSRFR